MLKEKIYPYLLVIIQFSCLLFILTTGPLLASGLGGILVETAGIILGILAIYNMGLGNFNVTPRPKKQGKLVTHGVYKYIRHPMYSAQLIALSPLIVEYPGWHRIIAYMLLLIALLLKIWFEESHLRIQFDGYAEYMKQSKRLIPYLF
jgi:protein-S-isoprenylcysteine O-methyltransferase Ste14